MKHFYQDIKGMMDYEDLYSDMVRKFPDGSTFVELGTWHGRSAAYLCTEIVNAEKDIKVHTVDWFLKCDDRAFKLMDKFDFLQVHKNHTAHQSQEFYPQSIDFVFIDADHSYDGVQADINAWLPLVKKGGVLAGHDFENERYPELKWAVLDLLPEAYKVSKMCWRYDV